MPFVGAAEQTVIQQVVPLPRIALVFLVAGIIMIAAAFLTPVYRRVSVSYARAAAEAPETAASPPLDE
ncbi:UNVERIFIED_ORG: hypothetical protein ABIB52_003198 [Arthrobacter sp. UYCu721]